MNDTYFYNKFKNDNAFDQFWNYLISILLILFGVFFIYHLHYTNWYEVKAAYQNDIAPKGLLYFGVLFMIIMGAYGFWRIPKLYKINTILTDKSISEKSRIIKLLAQELKLKELQKSKNYIHFRYRGPFWNPLDIYLFYDEEKICFNVQQYELASNRGGFIDFGTSKRLVIKMKRKLKILIKASA